MIEEIALKIIDLLKADPDLAFNWFFEPPVRAPRLPYGWVDFEGGEAVRWSRVKTLFSWRYHIVVVDRKRSDADSTEQAVMDRIEKAFQILKANPTLDGLVEDSEVLAIEGDYVQTPKESLIGARLMLRVKVWL